MYNGTSLIRKSGNGVFGPKGVQFWISEMQIFNYIIMKLFVVSD